MQVRGGGTLIRKTSLLHKIDPTALRSSFADMNAAERFASPDAYGDSVLGT